MLLMTERLSHDIQVNMLNYHSLYFEDDLMVGLFW